MLEVVTIMMTPRLFIDQLNAKKMLSLISMQNTNHLQDYVANDSIE